MPENYDIELRSEEVQEVMNRIPPAIQRWGITVMALIVAIFFAIAYFVEIPVTEDCAFTMAWDKDTKEIKNIIHLSPSTLKSVQSDGTTEVRLHSDLFPDEYSSGISIVITVDQITLDSVGSYEVVFKTPPEIEAYLSEKYLTISGKATIQVTHKTLLDSFKLNTLKL